MLGRCIEILGGCGGGVPLRPSFFSIHCQSYGIQHQVHRLPVAGLVGHDTVVTEVSDHKQLQ